MKLNEIQDEVKNAVRMVARGRYFGLVVVGPGGLGKSYSVEQGLREGGYPFVVVNGHMTALALYQRLYKHRDRGAPLLVLEDIEHIFSSPPVLGLLRAATWGPRVEAGWRVRHVCWDSTSARLEELGLPRQFEFNSGLIMVGNTIPKNGVFEAFLSRVAYLEVTATAEEVFTLMRSIVRGGWKFCEPESKRVVELGEDACLEVVTFFEQTQVTDLRIFERALIAFVTHGRESPAWRRLIEAELQSRKRWQRQEAIVGEILNRKGLTTAEQLKLYEERTGKSRATFFRVKKRRGGPSAASGLSTESA